MKYLLLFLPVVLLGSCTKNLQDNSVEIYKSEIIKAEKDFARLVADSGLSVGFGTYAANEAKINRRDTLLSGKESIREFYKNQPYKSVKLEWEPDFVDVSVSGDLGYTYGKFIFQATDTAGKEIKSDGIFHTVWKRQADGAWKFVWD